MTEQLPTLLTVKNVIDQTKMFPKPSLVFFFSCDELFFNVFIQAVTYQKCVTGSKYDIFVDRF